jgi:beta-lactamase regulating signal transducer with metallopeptidase domain
VNSPALLLLWFQLLALLALEIGLVALVLALLRRSRVSAAWRRTFFQAGIIAVVVLAASELSGSGQALVGWVVRTITTPRTSMSDKANPGAVVAASPNQRTPIQPSAELAALRSESGVQSPTLKPSFRSNVESLVAVRRQAAAEAISRAGAAKRLAQFRSGPSFAQPRADLELHASDTADSIGILWLCLVWAVGAGLVGARVCFARCLFVFFRLRRHPVVDAMLLERTDQLAQALGIKSQVSVVESARLTGPIAFGLIHPAIGLPLHFSTRFDQGKQEAMLAHELAHLAAHDPLWCLLADLTAAVFWWHPAVWWMRHELRLANELAADDASLLVADGPRVLAECLVELGTRLIQPPQLGQLRVSGFRSHLGRRVQRLVHLEGGPWVPPNRLQAWLLRIFGPMAVAAVVVLCTAWAAPQALTKGNSMKTMQLNWKRSLATFALLAAVNAPEAAPAAVEPDKAPAATPALAPAPVIAGAPKSPVPAAPPSGPDAAFLRRYGIVSARNSAPQQDAAKRNRLEAKLNGIVLPEASFDALPLGEVLKLLSEQARKLDTEKQGINFLLNPNPPQGAITATVDSAVDPTTGLPLMVAPAEQIDLSSVAVKFSLPLRNVTMREVLDAVVKVAERPIEYSVEDYAVVVSIKPEMATVTGQPVVRQQVSPLSQPLVVRTYKVNTNTFLAGLENAFGIKVESTAANQGTRSRQVQTALKELLTQLGISMTPTKSVFYNDLTGMVMVRATSEDEEIVSAAIETLGGGHVNPVGGGGGFGAFGPAQ